MNRAQWAKTAFLNAGFTPPEIKQWVENMRRAQRAEYQGQLVLAALISALLTQFACHWLLAAAAALTAIRLFVFCLDFYRKLWAFLLQLSDYLSYTIVQEQQDV